MYAPVSVLLPFMLEEILLTTQEQRIAQQKDLVGVEWSRMDV